MSFEDDMIESGFSDEETYLEYLLNKHDTEQEQMNFSHNLNKSEISNPNIKYQDYLEIIRNNKIYNEVNEILKNRFLHSKLRFYKVMNCFPNKYPNTDYFYKIMNTEATKYGYCDNHSNITIPCIYDKIDLIQQGIAIVLDREKYFCINIDNKQITPFLEGPANWVGPRNILNYHNIKEAIEIELICPRPNCPNYSQHTLINTKGLMVRTGYNKYEQLPAKYTFIDYLYSDTIPLIPVKSNGKWGFIDKKLSEIIPCEYDAYDYSYDDDYIKLITGKPHHCFDVMKDGNWTVLDENGETLINFSN